MILNDVEVRDGNKFIILEGYQYYLKTEFAYGEDIWCCVKKRCKANLFLVKDIREDNKYIILTYKSSLKHYHQGNKMKKVSFCNDAGKEPEKIKMDFSRKFLLITFSYT